MAPNGCSLDTCYYYGTFKSPPFSLARRGKGGLFFCNFFQKPTFPLSLGERGKVGFFAAIFFKSPPFSLARRGKGGLFCCNFFQRLSINSGTQNSPWVEKTEEKSPVEFRVTVPDLSSPERIQDGRHARAETNNSKGSPWVEKMEEKSPVEFRLTVPDL